MSWARFDDKYSNNPKVVAAGPWGELLDMRAIIYCAQNETDGFVGADYLSALLREIPAPKKRVERLVAVGRWRVVDGGWEVVNYLTYNPARAKLEADRATARERMNKARNQRRSSAEQSENFKPASPNPVPSRPPINSSHQGLHAEPDLPVDRDVRSRGSAILDRIIESQMERANGSVQNPDKYRAKVRGDVLARSIGLPRLVAIIENHPDAPDEMLAAAFMQEPTPYLRNYAVSA